jgi:hypothetical protein
MCDPLLDRLFAVHAVSVGKTTYLCPECGITFTPTATAPGHLTRIVEPGSAELHDDSGRNLPLVFVRTVLPLHQCECHGKPKSADKKASRDIGQVVN